MRLVLLAASIWSAGGPSVPPCTAAPPGTTAAAALERAVAATGMRALDARVMHIRSRMVRELRDLGDRPSPPFDASVTDEDFWFDPSTGAESSRTPMPALPAMQQIAQWQRAFNALAIVADWVASGDARVEGRCVYRDYPRLVLLRDHEGAAERLFINEMDGVPVALERVERSYFMGPERVEYLYYNWEHLGPTTFALSAMRIVDGKKDRLRAVQPAATTIVPRDSVPTFPRADSPSAMSGTVVPPPEPFWTTDAPDTVRVGAHAFLLVNSAFTSAVALAADTVFILDSPQGEHRARQDSAWIGRLFPGRHALAFVVATDIWPHIAGLRYWVANGATVITHPATVPLVRSAITRRWTGAPDLLERRRSTLRLRVDTVRTPQARGGGAIRIFAVDGVASEGVLAAFAAPDRFLWASDRVQDTTNASLYVTELRRAVHRVGLAPLWTSGPHFSKVPWMTVDALARE